MHYTIELVIKQWLEKNRIINHIHCLDSHFRSVPIRDKQELPKLLLVIDGELTIQSTNFGNQAHQLTLCCDSVLYSSIDEDYQVRWSTPATALNIEFGKQDVNVKLLKWDSEHFTLNQQIRLARRGPRVGSFIIQALSELTWQTPLHHHHSTLCFLIQSLLSHLVDLLEFEFETTSKTQSLFKAIRSYIDTHFKDALTRDFLADLFYISPNYLSYLFHKEGNSKLSDYINTVRLEYAKSLLKGHELNIKQIAAASGFDDSNYFCRVFKKKTERKPSQYRRQYHSQLLKSDREKC